jgi:hypothetical protein
VASTASTSTESRVQLMAVAIAQRTQALGFAVLLAVLGSLDLRRSTVSHVTMDQSMGQGAAQHESEKAREKRQAKMKVRHQTLDLKWLAKMKH